MKKYKNVRAIKARKCSAYINYYGKDTFGCIGVREPFKNPTCGGYCCKCTEYDYKRSVKRNGSKNPR